VALVLLPALLLVSLTPAEAGVVLVEPELACPVVGLVGEVLEQAATNNTQAKGKKRFNIRPP
jgi:hypothetical protein